MLVWILVFVIGACVGSFLNVCIDRLPEGKSIIKPPSHCPGCNRRLTALELVPVVSYLALRGRCRTCGARIPARILVVEVGVGLLYTLLYINYGPTTGLLVSAAYLSVFLLLSVIDLEQGLIPNNIVYPVVVVSMVAAPFRPLVGVTGLVPFEKTVWGPSLVFLGGGVILFVVFFAIALLSRGGMGGGDIKMAGLAGLAVGLANAPAAMLVSWVIGGMVAVAMVLVRGKGRKDSIPFGPFLAVGATVALLWGEPLTRWYLHLMGL